MKIIEGFKKTLFVDKILYPSKKHRIWLWVPYPIAIGTMIGVGMLRNDALTVVAIGLACIYLCFLPTMLWMQKATQYIWDKEKKTEVKNGLLQ